MIPLQEIKDYLAKVEIPTQLRLNEYTYISDSKKFLESHFATLERNKGNKTFLPYYDRLLQLYTKLKKDG